MGMPSERAVTSSWAVIWKQPSPSMHQTTRSGRPALAPMAAGTPKPMVPAPPELTQVPGLFELPELRGPHLVLADARGHDGARRRRLGDGLDHELGTQQALVTRARRRRGGTFHATR